MQIAIAVFFCQTEAGDGNRLSRVAKAGRMEGGQ